MEFEKGDLMGMIQVGTKRIGWSGLAWYVWTLFRVNYNARRGGYKVKIDAIFPMPWW